MIRDPQATFSFQHTRTSTKKQWDTIRGTLDANPAISDPVVEYRSRNFKAAAQRLADAKGMTTKQTLRFAVLKSAPRTELSRLGRQGGHFPRLARVLPRALWQDPGFHHLARAHLFRVPRHG